MNDAIDWLRGPAASPNAAAGREAADRQLQLTKPPGALGQLEALAIRLAALQGTPKPAVERVHVTVFAADHGVAAEQVSAFPQGVTVEMLRNFAHGGGAINVLARELGAILEVINLGTVNDPGPLEGVLDCRLGPGTENFTRAPAMSPEQCARATRIGRDAAERAFLAGAQLYIGGEMGIGNTTAAAALAALCSTSRPNTSRDPAPGSLPPVSRIKWKLSGARLFCIKRISPTLTRHCGAWAASKSRRSQAVISGARNWVYRCLWMASSRASRRSRRRACDPGAAPVVYFRPPLGRAGSSSGARGHGRATAPRSRPAARRRQRRRGRGPLAAARLRLA